MKTCLEVGSRLIALKILSELQSVFSDAIQGFGIQRNSPVDLVSIDINMPALSSELIWRRLLFQETLNRGYTTAYSDFGWKAWNSIALDYLIKAFSSQSLSRHVKKAQNGRICNRGENGSLFIKTSEDKSEWISVELLFLRSRWDYCWPISLESESWFPDDPSGNRKVIPSFFYQTQSFYFIVQQKSPRLKSSDISVHLGKFVGPCECQFFRDLFFKVRFTNDEVRIIEGNRGPGNFIAGFFLRTIPDLLFFFSRSFSISLKQIRNRNQTSYIFWFDSNLGPSRLKKNLKGLSILIFSKIPPYSKGVWFILFFKLAIWSWKG